jgi:glycosyltransferase involved in cell wall biosynthesis
VIFINALSALQGGGQTYLLHLLKRIPEHLHGKIIVLAHQKNKHIFFPYKTQVKVLVSDFASRTIFHRMFFEKFLMKKLLLKEKAKVYFSVSGILPTWKMDSIRFVSVFQNQLPFQSKERKRYPFGYTRLKFIRIKFLQLQALKNADLCIFLTKDSKKIIESQSIKKAKNSVVIPHGIDSSFRKEHNTNFPKKISGQYVLYVSILDVYKAQLEVVIAWDLLRKKRKTKEKLILIGPENPYYGKKVRNLIKKLDLKDEVLIIGELPHNELSIYYNSAKINLFASSCETFPFILLEQLASGTAILCSNYVPFEIAEGGVEYFDPYQPETLTNLLLLYLDDECKRNKLEEKAIEHSKKFDWAETASKTWKALEQQIGS